MCTLLVTLVPLTDVPSNNVLCVAFIIEILSIVKPSSEGTYSTIYCSLFLSSVQSSGCIIGNVQHRSEILHLSFNFGFLPI